MDTFEIIEKMLENEKNISKQKKPKKYIKVAPTKPVTDTDLKLSGWNFKYDPDYKNKHGDSEFTIKHGASPYKMACVVDQAYSIYGWGVSIDEAISDCKKNVKAWKKAYPGQIPVVNKLTANRTSEPNKAEDKDVGSLLSEAGL